MVCQAGRRCTVGVVSPVRCCCRSTLRNRSLSEDVWKASPETVTAG